MKVKLLLIATVLALIGSFATPAVAVVAKPPHTEFSAVIIPGVVEIIEETNLGESGRLLVEEYIGGFIPFSTWSVLSNARVDITATTNYIQYPTYEREGTMRGRMVITSLAGGTLELNYTSRISGFGGFTFDGQWTVLKATGVFKGIQAKGAFYTDQATGAPILAGMYWVTGNNK